MKSNQIEILLKISASRNNDPRLVKEEDCELLLGNVILNLPVSEDRIKMEVRMMFG